MVSIILFACTQKTILWITCALKARNLCIEHIATDIVRLHDFAYFIKISWCMNKIWIEIIVFVLISIITCV